jgi:uncharacterized protein YkwD
MKTARIVAGLWLALTCAACGEAEDSDDTQQPAVMQDMAPDQAPDLAPDLPPAPACPVEGQEVCGATCVDTQTDVEHCGACGERCGRGAGCKMGACFCLTGGTWCGAGQCLTTLNDTNNCGECGKKCVLGEYCSEGTCVADHELSEVVRLTNEARKIARMCGDTSHTPVGQLTVNVLLNKSAQGHAQDMSDRNYFEHNTPEGTTPGQRMRAAGYMGGLMGENIAYGQANAQEVVAGWIKSPGHCRNIMNGDYAEIGVGVFRNPMTGRIYWVQNFGHP